MIANFFILLINKIVELLGVMGELAMKLLPDSPFTQINNYIIDSNLLKALNWVIPIDVAINILTLWIPALFIIYVVRVVLKWIKAL